MTKRTRLQIQQIMMVCWEKEFVSKEQIYKKVCGIMSEKRLEDLLKSMVHKHYIYKDERGYRAVIMREKFKYSFNLLDCFKDDANPNVMAPSNGNLYNGGGTGGLL